MARSATRLKAPAMAAAVPQSRDECAAAIRKLGDVQRQVARETAAMNDLIAEVTQRYQPGLDAMAAQAKALQDGIQTWCEAHRAELTDGNRVKSANLVTGAVSWRQRPPSVSIRGAESVLETLKRLGLARFIRVREEPNKEAMLNEPEAVRGVAGITIVSGVEDFAVEPFEQEVAQ